MAKLGHPHQPGTAPVRSTANTETSNHERFVEPKTPKAKAPAPKAQKDTELPFADDDPFLADDDAG